MPEWRQTRVRRPAFAALRRRGMTFKAIAELYGISEARVRQILKKETT